MKNFMTCMMLLCSSASFAANSLLKNPTTGALPAQSTINSIAMISNSTDVALVLGNAGAVYVLDINDAKTSDAANNTISSVSAFATSKLDAVAGKVVNIIDMVVNPRSRSVYILGRTTGTSSFNFHVFKVTNKGNTVTMLNLNAATFSKVNMTAGYNVNSIAFGDNTLYVSASKSGLNAELNYMKPPFTHNASFSQRQTSMFKSNWGTSYVTTAPLEKMAYGVVKNTKRLAGVTVCAPGFSLDLSKLSGSGALQVSEDFDVNSGLPSKVMLLNHDGKSWLYDLHDNFAGGGNLYRIGEKFLDGSQVAANKHNTNSQKLRANNGSVTTGMSEADMKLIGKFAAVATWDDGRLLVLEPKTEGAALKLITVGKIPTPASVPAVAALPLSIAPNPAQDRIQVQLPQGMNSGKLIITAMDGRVLRQEELKQGAGSVSLGGLPAGNYSVRVSDGQQLATAMLQIQ